MTDYTAAGFTLLQGVHLYMPEGRGIYGVLVANGRTTAVVSSIPSGIVPNCTVVNLSGQILCLGFIGQRVHLIDGSGEAGPTTRTPEVALNCLTETDVTSTIGLLGTGSVPCYLESLFAKTHALSEESISTWTLTGAYHVPFRTTTGSVERDVAIIDRVIGAKCTISDHHSATPDVYHLANMVAEPRVGDLLGDKPDVIVFHMGDSKEASQPVYDLLENYDAPISKPLPAHVNRNVPLSGQTLEFACEGDTIGIISSTDESVVPAEGIVCAAQVGIPLVRVILDSDGSGSQPLFDDEGNLTHVGVVGFEMLLETVQVLVKDYDFSISDTLRSFTGNVAGLLNLIRKGGILPGNDTDLLVTTPELRIEQVYAYSKLMVEDGEACAEGTFEMA